MCALHVIGDLLEALVASAGLLAAFRRALEYLLDNARRENPKRDREVVFGLGSNVTVSPPSYLPGILKTDVEHEATRRVRSSRRRTISPTAFFGDLASRRWIRPVGS
jgi:hypothetical protein